MNRETKEVRPKQGRVDTSNYSDKESDLLAFATQLRSSDIVIDAELGNAPVITSLAKMHGLDTSRGLQQLISDAMVLLTRVEQSTGEEQEGW